MPSAEPISFSSPNVQEKTTPRWRKRSAAITDTPPSTPVAITPFIWKTSSREKKNPSPTFEDYGLAPSPESLCRKASSKA
jgi:hypothetical protein